MSTRRKSSESLNKHQRSATIWWDQIDISSYFYTYNNTTTTYSIYFNVGKQTQPYLCIYQKQKTSPWHQLLRYPLTAKHTSPLSQSLDLQNQIRRLHNQILHTGLVGKCKRAKKDQKQYYLKIWNHKDLHIVRDDESEELKTPHLKLPLRFNQNLRQNQFVKQE